MYDHDDPLNSHIFSIVLKVLHVLKQASQSLQHFNSTESNSVAIKALLELQTESKSILLKDPLLYSLSQHLSKLKSLVGSIHESPGCSSFLTRRASTQSISRVAELIEIEIQAWIDRECLDNLSKALKDKKFMVRNEDEVLSLLVQFIDRVSLSFDRELQSLLLRSNIFTLLAFVLCDTNVSKRIREYIGSAIAGLIRFNKDVFVGQVSMEPIVNALLSLACSHSLRILSVLIKFIKSPFVDEIESSRKIPTILNFLDSKEMEIKIGALYCILEIGYFGRKEAIEAMIQEGLIEKLTELQRSDLGGDLIDIGRFDIDEKKYCTYREVNVERKRESRQTRFLECYPFASCVARFAIQLEVGEGLRQRERRAFKQEILVRVRKECFCDANSATIIAEVLWGSTP
ncbi:hypothetical protein ACFE04_010043 [Oxalis oulophora]